MRKTQESGAFLHFYVENGVEPTFCEAQGSHFALEVPLSPSAHNVGRMSLILN